MKHLRYTGDAHVRSFSAEDLKSMDVDEDEGLEFDKRSGGVLEMKNASAEKLLERYPDDFEEIDSDQAEQLQMEVTEPLTVANETTPTEDSATDTPAGATRTNRTRSSTRTS